jgi:CRP-like cAMP-binding protein
LTAEGEYPDAMYIVRFGTVEVKVQGETVLTAETGDLFGENALLGLTSDGKRNRSSFAKTMCEICALRKEDLWDLLKIESFRRPFSTLVHQHISRLDSSTLVSNVSKASRYCVNWGQLTKQRSIRNMLQREKEQAQIVRKESLERAKGPGSSKYMAQTELNSILRTQLTLLVESIRIKSSEIKEVHNQIHAVLAFSWRGEQRGQLWVPTLSWSEPFLLMLPNPREGAEDDYLHVPLQKVQIITLTHYTADWKTLPPLVIKLFQVTMDSIHFIAPVSMPENQSPMENHLFESSAGLRYLAGT